MTYKKYVFIKMTIRRNKFSDIVYTNEKGHDEIKKII